MVIKTHGVADSTPLLALKGELTQSIVREKNPGDLVRVLAEACLEFPSLDCFWIWSHERINGRLKLESAAGVGPRLLEILGSFPDSGIVANHLLMGNEVIKGWPGIWQGSSDLFLECGLNQVGVVPLIGQRVPFAAFGFGSKDEKDFDPGLLDILRNVLKEYCLRREFFILENQLAEVRHNLGQVHSVLEDRLFVVDSNGQLLSTGFSGSENVRQGQDLDSVLTGGNQIFKNHCLPMPVDSGKGEKVPQQSRLRGENGHLTPVEVVIKDVHWSGQTASMLICRDITDQLVVEKERDRLVMAIEQTADSIVITDSSGTIQYTNPAFTKVTGYEADEALGANPRILKSQRHDPAFYRQMWATILRGETWEGRVANRKKSGEEYWEKASISPVRDSTGIITHFVGVKRDITDEMKLEERQRQNQRLAAVGTLAGGIAHDFNNILYALLGNSQLAMDDIPANHPAHLPLTEIVKAGERGSALVAKMLAFGQRSEGERVVKPLAPIIREAMDLARASLPSTIGIRMDLEAGCPPLLMDEAQIHQVVLNLCTNAAHAMGTARGLFSIHLKTARVREDSPEEMNGVAAGEYLQLTVSDTGVGMDKSVISRIFEPYFTTKMPHEGTGLGLASVHGIVMNHNGRIFVKSVPGNGTTFILYFPVAKNEAEKEVQPPKSSIRPEGNARVMVVDDEKMITDVMVRGLKKYGFEVTGFVDGIKALEVFRENPEAFDMVITDQTMPNVTGFELAAHLSSIRADLPIILSTGYSKTVNQEELQSAGISRLVSKPLKIKDLAEVLCSIHQPLATTKGE
jgi:PAS domain S-box-containing protein